MSMCFIGIHIYPTLLYVSNLSKSQSILKLKTEKSRSSVSLVKIISLEILIRKFLFLRGDRFGEERVGEGICF